MPDATENSDELTDLARRLDRLAVAFFVTAMLLIGSLMIGFGLALVSRL